MTPKPGDEITVRHWPGIRRGARFIVQSVNGQTVNAIEVEDRRGGRFRAFHVDAVEVVREAKAS